MRFPIFTISRRDWCAALLCCGLWPLAALAAQAAAPPASPRIVALAPHLAELTCAAGACEQLVGRVAYSDYPQTVAQLPLVGDAFAVNLEALMVLQPDLVLAWDGGTSAAQQAQLARLGVQVRALKVETLDEIAGAVRQIGAWAGTAAIADQAAGALNDRLQALRAQYAQRAPLRVLYQIELQPMFSISKRSPISQAIRTCGGRNLFADLPGVAAPVNAEAAVAAAPQAIVFSRHEDVAAIRQWWSRFVQVPAVANAALFEIDGDLLARAGPRMLDGVAQLCEALQRAR